MRRGTVPFPLRIAVRTGAGGAAVAAKRVAFWVAVAFPAVYLGAYALDGVVPVPDALIVSAFLLNALALVAGHAYGRENAAEPARTDGSETDRAESEASRGDAV